MPNMSLFLVVAYTTNFATKGDISLPLSTSCFHARRPNCNYIKDSRLTLTSGVDVNYEVPERSRKSFKMTFLDA